MFLHTSMFLCLSTTLLAGTSNFANATPLFRRDNTQPVGTNPIANPTVDYLGVQTANNSCSHRDLGFTGAIAGKYYAVYGDTLWCAAGVTDPNMDVPGFHGMVRDSISAVTDDPLRVHDLDLGSNGRQNQFVPFNATWGEASETGFGGTSLVEVDASTGTGAVFYLVNPTGGLKGAGVAEVQVMNGTPTVTKRFGNQGFWWAADSDPHYGDIAAFRDSRSEYIYAWGNPPTTANSFPDNKFVYMVRVKACEAFNLSSYEYWWGRQVGWKSDRLDSFTSDTAAMWGVGQGQVVWNALYQCYIFVHLDLAGSGAVYLRTASSPEGPWTPDVKIFQAQSIDDSQVYAGVAHPYLDESGNTLTVSFSNHNTIQVIKATFHK